MPLAPGSRLGRYQIQALLGSGGMGEVYRATDPQLKREVAIKVLPEAADLSPERLQRFRQEALATAALNHPHVVAVYDAGAEGAATYVVSELLEGRDLREILSAGPITPRKALRYALQIADGLAAVHEKGIVHRDLKPENLFVTRDDHVKILDFGIARLVEDETPGAAHATGTVAGTILGTVGYMSPEQMRGECVDHRSDIFAFGAVLYEMLTGRRAFGGHTAVDTLSAILHEEPPAWIGDGTALSNVLRRLTRRCLEKAAALRFQSARDLAIVLGDVDADGPAEASASDIVYVPNVPRLRHFEVMTRRGERRPLPMAPVAVAAPSVSPNGERIAFTAIESISNVNLRLYDIAADSLTRLTSDGNSRYSRWIDDERLMFQHRGPVSALFALTIGGTGRPAEAPRALTNVDSFPMFVDGDALVYGIIKGQDTDLHRAPMSDPAKSERLLERPGHQQGAVLSPDRKWVAYVSDELVPNTFDLYLASTTALLRPRRLNPGARGVRWSRTGSELLFVKNGTLFALAIDGSGSPAGEPQHVADNVSADDPGFPSFDTLPDGRLLLTVDEPQPADALTPVVVLNWAARLRQAAARK
jgi:serine/threonine protein kinase